MTPIVANSTLSLRNVNDVTRSGNLGDGKIPSASACNEVRTPAPSGGDVDVLKQLIELQSQVVELSRRNAETEKSVAQLRHEVALIRRQQKTHTPATLAVPSPQKAQTGLLNVLRAQLKSLPKALRKNTEWPGTFTVRPARSTGS